MQPPSTPHETRPASLLPGSHSLSWEFHSQPLFICVCKKPALSISHGLQLIEAPEQSRSQPFRGPSFPLCCPLCSSISLTKSVWKPLRGFLPISLLGNPRTPTPVTNPVTLKQATAASVFVSVRGLSLSALGFRILGALEQILSCL